MAERYFKFVEVLKKGIAPDKALRISIDCEDIHGQHVQEVGVLCNYDAAECPETVGDIDSQYIYEGIGCLCDCTDEIDMLRRELDVATNHFIEMERLYFDLKDDMLDLEKHNRYLCEKLAEFDEDGE